MTPSELVEKAEGLLDRAKESEDRKGTKSKLWEQTSQLRNLVQITQTESEVPVLRNFIRYQQGRRSTKEFWGLIGDDVLAVLAEIDTEEGTAETRSRAIRNFFGYLVRHYVYLNETRPRGGPPPSAGRSGQGPRPGSSGPASGNAPGARRVP